MVGGGGNKASHQVSETLRIVPIAVGLYGYETAQRFGLIMRNLKSAACYFALVFAVGFALGCIRVPFLVPRLGQRAAELLEAPFMFAAIIFSARWVSRTFPGSTRQLLNVGLIAVGFLFLAELTVDVLISGRATWEVFFNRDPLSGAVYYVLVAIFAVMPALARVGTQRNVH